MPFRTRRTPVRPRVLVTVLVGVAGVAGGGLACSSTSSGVGNSSAELSSSGSAPAPGTKAPGSSTTVEGDDSPGTTQKRKSTTTTKKAPLAAVPELSGDFCADLSAMVDYRIALDAEDDAEDDNGTPDDQAQDRAEFEASRDAITALRDEGPDELVPSFDKVLDTFEQAIAIEEQDLDDTAELSKMFELLFDPAFLQAGDTINAYGHEVCGLTEDFIETGPGRGDVIPDESSTTTTYGSIGADDSDIVDRLEARLEGTILWDLKIGYVFSKVGDSVDLEITGTWTQSQALDLCHVAEEENAPGDTLNIRLLAEDGTTIIVRDETTSYACTPV